MTFDEPNLVTQHVRLDPDRPGAANPAKALTVLAGMLAGADSIDDLDMLRAGATPAVFDDLRAPSTIGTWLRDQLAPTSNLHSHGHGRCRAPADVPSIERG